MVLSNKKLKQKLRKAKVESLSATDPETPNSQLRELLEAAAKQRPRLSKREKRRKNQPLEGLDSEGNDPHGENGQAKKKKVEEDEKGEVKAGDGVAAGGDDDKKKRKAKKRKREEGGGEEKSGADKDEKIEVRTGDGEVGDGKKKKRKAKKTKRKEGESEEKSAAEEDEVVKQAKKAKQKKKQKKKKKNKAKTKEGDVGDNGIQGSSESQLNEGIVTKVYVGGIPYYSTEDDIRSFFEGCGTITEVDCMTFPDSGKFRGIAIIGFKTDAAVKRALALDGADMGGFYLKVQPYKARASKVSDFAPKIVAGYNRIYVGNLSWDVTEDDLRKFFSDCNVSSVRFGMDKDTGEFRGYGHVDFSDNLSLTMALKLDQQIVCGRPIKISCAVPLRSGKVQPTPVPATENPGNSEPSVSSGKIRRRTCYECGEKGHLSSACPNKQTADATNSNTS